jgi:hypothetical protein
MSEAKAIMAATDAILATCDSATTAHEAINWSDLRCVRVIIGVDQDDKQVTLVEIEEAAPDAWRLQQYVAHALENQGYDNIEVITEW